MALRAVVFDYGMVLTAGQDMAAHAEMMRITGLPFDRFERFYWADRHAYDEGKLTGTAYWRKFVDDAGLKLDPSAVEELNGWDARMWTTQNSAMVAWQQRLKHYGLQTAILSNMGDRVLEEVLKTFDWVDNFDALVWSYRLGIAKPAPEIYAHVLNQLGTAPAETLFIDDKQVNVDAALALGIRGLLFSNIDRLRADLAAQGYEAELPLPE